MSWIRHMKTTQEIRQWFADAKEVKLRRSRSPRMLPTNYSDKPPAMQKSWKEHRRTKWLRIKDHTVTM